MPCPDCGGDDPRRIAREFGIVVARCRSCGLVYTRTPRPVSQDHYLVSRETFMAKYGSIVRDETPHPRDANYEEHLETLERLTEGRDLLDVGSHAGFFMRRARGRGWNVQGVEPSPVSAQLARDNFDLRVLTGTLDSVELPSESFDVATLTDVLEHIPHPRALLQALRGLLRPGGRVFIKVPNVRYVRAKQWTVGRLPGATDDIYDAREHLVYYSETTLRRMVESSGFEVELLQVPSPIQTGGTLRRGFRAAGARLARVLPGGVGSPLATDLVIVGRRPS